MIKWFTIVFVGFVEVERHWIHSVRRTETFLAYWNIKFSLLAEYGEKKGIWEGFSRIKYYWWLIFFFGWGSSEIIFQFFFPRRGNKVGFKSRSSSTCLTFFQILWQCETVKNHLWDWSEKDRFSIDRGNFWLYTRPSLHWTEMGLFSSQRGWLTAFRWHGLRVAERYCQCPWESYVITTQKDG